MCELKFSVSIALSASECRTPCGVCELKFVDSCVISLTHLSHPVWGVWVEIKQFRIFKPHLFVAPRVGCVSWNLQCFQIFFFQSFVAPRVGCVSWNFIRQVFKFSYSVAPRVGCVSWNWDSCIYLLLIWQSHPVWGVWVEIRPSRLLKEKCSCRTPCGVCELKLIAEIDTDGEEESHPVWGVWVEIQLQRICLIMQVVAPRVGCVSWNFL